MFSSVSAALLLADHDDAPATDPGKARHDRLVIAEQAVAVQLDELVGHLGDELEGPRPAQGPGQLDAGPDVVAGGGRGLGAERDGSFGPAVGVRGRDRRRRAGGGWFRRRPVAIPRRELPDPVRDRGQERQRPERRQVLVRADQRREGPAGRQQAQQARDLAAQVRAGDHAVHEAVAEQEFGPLEAGRKLGGDGAGRDPGAGEPDQGVRLGQVDVPDHGEGREHAPGRRIGQERDEGHAAGPQALEDGQGLGQLHQGERPLLHAGAPGRAHDDQRHPRGQGVLRGAGHLLADDRAHRAAHEPEVHDAQGHVRPADRPDAPHGGIAHAGGQLRRGQAIGVGLLVHEAQRVDGLQAGIALGPRPGVQQVTDAGGGR